MNKFKQILKHLTSFLNKYIILSIVFVACMSLGEYSFFNYCKSKQAIAELKKTEKNYEKHIEEAKEDLRQLDQNKHNLERFAREKYLMHKEKEDIFIINEE